MTETDRKLTALEWRLYIVALLGAMYVITWRVLDRPAAATNAALPPAPATRVLPPATSSPAPAPPRATRGNERLVRQPVPRPVRVPPRRIRTRSS